MYIKSKHVHFSIVIETVNNKKWTINCIAGKIYVDTGYLPIRISLKFKRENVFEIYT